MKSAKSNILPIATLVLALIFQQVTSYAQSFECTSDLYQVVNGKDLKVLTPSTGVYETVGSSSISYNGAGFNSEDGYIYGIGSGTVLVRVDTTGQATSLGSITGFTALSYSGDFDLNGNWHSFKKNGSSWVMNTIDVSVQPPVAVPSVMTELAGVGSAGNTADISYNVVSNKFYGMNLGKLIEYDPINKTVKTVADYSAETPSGGFGAVWSDQTGKTYFFNNTTGNIYRADIDENGNILSFAFIATSAPNGSNDGMGCPQAQSPVFPEICDNGIDDDGDGLIDCEDPDCTATTSCGVSGTIYSSTDVCEQSIATYHTFYTNNSNLSNTISISEVLPQGFIFLQDTIEFDAGGFSDLSAQPLEGDTGAISWGIFTLEAKETVRISYDVSFDENVIAGTNSNNIQVTLGTAGTIFTPSTLSSDMTVGDCPAANPYICEPAFYQVYKKKGKNQPNVFGRLNPENGDYEAIAVASDYANGLGYDVNSGLVYGASGKTFISLDENGVVLDQGIKFSKKVYRGDINENSEWYGAVGSDLVKIDVSGVPVIMETYTNQALPGWDMAYNMDGHFYSIHNQTLYQFNTITNTKSTIGSLNGSGIPTSGGYGAQWTGSDGYLYASHNVSGNILRVDVQSAEARLVSLSTDGLSKNDGFSCPTNIPVVYEFDHGDNSRLPTAKILAYRQDLNEDNIPDFSTFWFGNSVNFEAESLANDSADGDLDDGFTLTTEIDNQNLTAVYGLNTNIEGMAYFLTGFDWDDDGVFDEVLTDSLFISSAHTLIDSVSIPASFEEGYINVRVIISEMKLNASQISGEILALGEVEDFRYLITAPCESCEVSTGSNGGLESRGDLSQAISKRNYSRSKNNSTKHLKSNQPRLSTFKQSRLFNTNGLSDYFPEVGATGKEEVTVSSPKDLIGITNATDVFSADYYLNNRRVAASMLLETKDQVYNHSKNVCDRLNGKAIQDVQIITIDGINIIFAKIVDNSGVAEYSSWFSSNDADDHYEVVSLWNVDNYPAGSYLNFQVWSSSPNQVFHILKHLLAQLSAEKTITNSLQKQLPNVLVKSGSYENGELRLTILNKNEATSVTIESNSRETEQADFSSNIQVIDLNGNPEQEIIVNSGFLFDVGISLKVDNAVAYDALYLADGAWGTDFNEEYTQTNNFDITSVESEISEDEYLVERGFEVSGTTTDVINVFRNLKAGEKTLSVTQYTSLSFDVKNNTPIEVILVEKGLIDWEDRLRVEIPAHSEMSKETILLSDFMGTHEGQSLDLQSIVISYVNKSKTSEYFEFSLNNVTFGNRDVPLSVENDELSNVLAYSIYPNPANNYLMFDLPNDVINTAVSIFDIAGKKVLDGAISQESNKLDIALNPGVYHVIIDGSSERITKRLLIK